MKPVLMLLAGMGMSWAGMAQAHDSRPLFLELTQPADGQYTLRWDTPDSVPQTNLPRIVPPPSCELTGELVAYHQTGSIVQSQALRCAERNWAGGFRIHYPRGNPSLSTLARYEDSSGRQTTEVLAPGQSLWSPPGTQRRIDVAMSYARLGVEHIAEGVDHLLFLACLMWIAGTARRVLITVTGFTLAHSVTLVLGALEIVRVPVLPLEANIALSILFLAVEITKGRRDSLTWNYPISVSSGFGLLHGFGFATALQDIGLPQSDMVVGLLFFNLGVELGQLVIVAAIALVSIALRVLLLDLGLTQQHRTLGRQITGYLVGVAAAVWFISRTLAFV